MTTRRERGVGTTRALRSHAEDVVRAVLVGLPPRRRTPRDLAFHAYLRRVRRLMRQPPAEFRVIGREVVAASRHSVVVEVRLRTDVDVSPGDVLHVLWRNDPARVAAAAPVPAGWHWTTPIPHQPSRLRRATAEDLLAEVIDLGEDDPQPSATRSERVTPRFFTVAGAGSGVRLGTEVSVQVTLAAGWPARGAAYLHRAVPGDLVRARVLPHPHRVPLGEPGLAVVTGSGAAGVFAALRAGASGVRLVWGLGDKTLAPWVEQELDAHLASGALAAVRLVRSPERVTDVLGSVPVDPAEWVYVSGHERMGEDVDTLLAARLGAERLGAMSDALRYVVST